MMMSRIASPLGWLSVLAMLFSLALPLQSPAREDGSESNEEAITLEQLPEKVREAVKLATTGGEIEKVERETADGKTAYEIEAEVEGGTVELTFNSDGQLIGIEVAEVDEEGDDEEANSEDHDGDRQNAEAGKKGAQKSSAKDDDEVDEGDEDDDDAGAEMSADISIDKVPPAARAAIGKRAGDAKLVGVEATTEAGATVYEAAWMKGHVKREVTVSASGDVISEESSISLAELPEALQVMAKKFAIGGELKLERKSVVLYELEVVKGGKTDEMYVDASGREVSIQLGDNNEEHSSDAEDDDYNDDNEGK